MSTLLINLAQGYRTVSSHPQIPKEVVRVRLSEVITVEVESGEADSS
jgi:hypothetical protein